MLGYIRQISGKDCLCTSVVFCYIFSFYIAGPVTSSIVIALPFMYLFIYDKEYYRIDGYSVRILRYQLLILVIGLFYSIVHLTFDLSYVKVITGQLLHIFFGICIVAEMRKRWQLTPLDIEKYIVCAFLIQSLIEIIASITPSFAASLLYFNRAYDFYESEPGRRGLALAAGTGWSLGLAYGLLYIVFMKRYLLNGINIYNIVAGVILLTGTMFAGRSGFVGAAFSIILFFLNANRGVAYKVLVVVKIILFVIFACLSFYLLFPTLTNHLVKNVFPFAFEPFYKLFYNNKFSMGSTDKLMEMWRVSIRPDEILLGTGYFTDPLTGSYYKLIDIGIMRNLFYWGIVGYVIMILYQLYLVSPIKRTGVSGPQKWNLTVYRFCLILYLFAMEFKAMTIGFNKMAVSVVFLLGYFYFHKLNTERQILDSYHKPEGKIKL